MRPSSFLSIWYVPCKSCTYLTSILTLSPNGPTELPLESLHLGVTSSASKMVSEPMVH